MWHRRPLGGQLAHAVFEKHQWRTEQGDNAAVFRNNGRHADVLLGEGIDGGRGEEAG